MGLKDLFWRSGQGGDDAGDKSGEDLSQGVAEEAIEGATDVPKGAVGKSPQGAASAGTDTNAILTADFPTIYTKTDTSGDANTDSVLTAYGELAAMDETPRRTAVQAVLTAMKARAAGIIETLDKRIKILAFLIQEQQKAADRQKRERADSLGRLSAEVAEQIAQLENRIRELRRSLKESEDRNAKADGNEQTAVSGFEQRVASETKRLGDLRDFLKGIVPQQGKK